jgi:phosphohistidine phosphatase
MNLILWRHAEAEEGADDMARALTRRGRRQAEMAAAWLARHAPEDMQILVSPAVRTRQTADALNRDYTIVPDIAPNASPDLVLASAGWPLNGQTVLVVGHQPTLGQATLNWTLKKGGIWWLGRRQRDEDFQVVLRAVVNPEFL